VRVFSAAVLSAFCMFAAIALIFYATVSHATHRPLDRLSLDVAQQCRLFDAVKREEIKSVDDSTAGFGCSE